MSDLKDAKLLALLDIVIDHYIYKGDPVWSKFLHSLEDVSYAPSTLRKYLNTLEQQGLVYQPYNSSGRIPTVKGFSEYIDYYLADMLVSEESIELDITDVRQDVKRMVESLGNLVDGVVTGFIKNDEYYFLGINNLLRDDLQGEYQTTRHIVQFIENKGVISLLNKKLVKRNHVYYTFIEDGQSVISCLYTKVVVWDYDCVLSVVGPTRVNYKKNVAILHKLVQALQ